MSDGQFWAKAEDQPYDSMLFLDSKDNPGGPLSVVVKASGCVEFRDDGSHTIPGLVHICELDDFVRRVSQLKALAVDRFGEDWGE